MVGAVLCGWFALVVLGWAAGGFGFWGGIAGLFDGDFGVRLVCEWFAGLWAVLVVVSGFGVSLLLGLRTLAWG